MSITNNKNHGMTQWLEENEPRTYGNFIDGKWINSSNTETFSLYNSAKKNQLLANFHVASEEEVNQAINSAHKAMDTWSKVPGPDRGAILYKFADLLEENISEISYILSAEQGKVLKESVGEIQRAAKEARFSAGEASRIDGNTLPSEHPNVWNSIVRKPIGVIAAIAPWNFPVVTPVRKLAPALAAGCTVVLKPASATPWTSVRIMELLTQAGIPDGAVNLVVGRGSKVGDPLVRHPLVKGISFTGSTPLGTTINEIAAQRLAKTQLELGGKNPAVVLDSEDINITAKHIAGAAFTCTGQRCTAISRVIVVKNLKDELIEAILKEMKEIKVGPPWSQEATIGPLINEQQLETTLNYIQLGKEEGAQLRFGGEVLTGEYYDEGSYITPALFDNVTPDMRIAKEEIFGPVLSVISAENEKEAIEIANDTEYGLGASIFTKDLSKAYRFAEQVESGMVHINQGTSSAAHIPFGGVKNSGTGAFSIGHSNIDFYTNMKAIYLEY